MNQINDSSSEKQEISFFAGFINNRKDYGLGIALAIVCMFVFLGFHVIAQKATFIAVGILTMVAILYFIQVVKPAVYRRIVGFFVSLFLICFVAQIIRVIGGE